MFLISASEEPIFKKSPLNQILLIPDGHTWRRSEGWSLLHTDISSPPHLHQHWADSVAAVNIAFPSGEGWWVVGGGHFPYYYFVQDGTGPVQFVKNGLKIDGATYVMDKLHTSKVLLWCK